MRKFFYLCYLIASFLFFIFLFPVNAYANSCSSLGYTITINGGKGIDYGNQNIKIKVSGAEDSVKDNQLLFYNSNYSRENSMHSGIADDCAGFHNQSFTLDQNGEISIDGVIPSEDFHCDLFMLNSAGNDICSEENIIKSNPPSGFADAPQKLCKNTDFTVQGVVNFNGNLYLARDGKCDGEDKIGHSFQTDTGGGFHEQLGGISADQGIKQENSIVVCGTVGDSTIGPLAYLPTITLYDKESAPADASCGDVSQLFNACTPPSGNSTQYTCSEGIPSDPSSADCHCLPEDFNPDDYNTDKLQSSQNFVPLSLCEKLSDDEESECKSCLRSGGVHTAIGCIPIGNMTSMTVAVLGFAAGIGGGITLLMIIAGGFIILTSSGNPEKLQTGKEIITNAIAGLLLILFSAVVLRVIGVDILQIPGFGTKPQ